MPFTAAQIARGATYALATYQKKEPLDQINVQHVTLDWLVKNKEVSSFGNGSFKEPLYISNGSNAQNYFGADQVTYNERDPATWTDWGYANLHDGFWFDEDRLTALQLDAGDLGNLYRALRLDECGHLDGLDCGSGQCLLLGGYRDLNGIVLVGETDGGMSICARPAVRCTGWTRAMRSCCRKAASMRCCPRPIPPARTSPRSTAWTFAPPSATCGRRPARTAR